MRKVTYLKIAFCLVTTSAAIGLAVHHVSKRYVMRSSLNATARSASLVATAIAASLKTAVQQSQVLLQAKASDDALNSSSTLLSVGMMEWQKENFAYLRRIDNVSFFRNRKLETKALSDALSLFNNDIANVGASQEQVYASLIGSDLPVLIIIAPFKPLDESGAPLSSVTVVEAAPYLAMLSDGDEIKTVVADRFGTTILNLEQERAIHRESLGANPLFKALISSAAPQQAGLYDGFYGSAQRLPFAGLAITAQLSTASAHKFLNDLWIMTALVATASCVTILTGLYLGVCARRRRSAQTESRAEEVKLAS